MNDLLGGGGGRPTQQKMLIYDLIMSLPKSKKHLVIRVIQRKKGGSW